MINSTKRSQGVMISSKSTTINAPSVNPIATPKRTLQTIQLIHQRAQLTSEKQGRNQLHQKDHMSL
jgi:hypothetical protein